MTEAKNKKILSISIDPDLLDRIDALCRLEGKSRSAYVERYLRNSVEGKESVLADMESPFNRAIFETLVKTPKPIIQAIAKIMGDNMTDEDWARVQKNAPQYTDEGKKQQQQKKKTGGKKNASSK